MPRRVQLRNNKRYVVQLVDENGRRVFSSRATLQGDETQTNYMLYIKTVTNNMTLWEGREPTDAEFVEALAKRRLIHDFILLQNYFKEDGSLELDLGNGAALLATPL